MKKIYAALLLIILFSNTGRGQTKKIQDLVGRWEVVNAGESGSGLVIIDSATLRLTYKGEEKDILTYSINFFKSPCWFDFSIRDSASIVNVKSLLEVVNDSLLKWQLFVGEDRTDHFSTGKGELFYLRKIVPTSAVSRL